MRSLARALLLTLASSGCLESPPQGTSGPGDDGGGPSGRLVGISYQPGGQIVDSLFEHADARQGTILLWFELGPDITALDGPVELAHLSGFSIALEPGDGAIVVRPDASVDDVAISAPLGDLEPGSAHLLSLRWDSTLVLGDLQHVSLRVDAGEAVYGVPDPFEPVLAPDTSQVLTGGASADDGPVIIRSAFVLRRPIRDDDPPSGVYLGIDDEHEAVFNAGVDGDPTLVFASFDVAFALSPHGDPSIEEPFRGWSQPFAENLLGAGGFMLSRNLDTDAWVPVDESGTLGGEPVTTSAATGTFNGGYRVENGSLQRIFTNGEQVQSGDHVLLRLIAYVGDAGSGARAIACVGAVGAPCANSLQGRANSSRLLPDVLVVGYEVGADDVEVRLTMTDDDGEGTRPVIVYAQAELYKNLLEGAGFESEPEFPPTGWSGSEGLESGELVQSIDDALIGTYGISIASAAPASDPPDAVLQEPAGMADLEFYLVGGFFRRAGDDPAGISAPGGSLFRQNGEFLADQAFGVPDPGTPGGWHHRAAVGKRLQGAGDSDAIRWGGTEPGLLTATAIDDTYVVRLAPVELTLLYAPP